MATLVDPAFRREDFFVAQYELKLDGRKADAELLHQVIEITYEDSVDGFDTFEIKLNNWDQRRRAVLYSDADTFLPGRMVELAFGYRGGEPLVPMIRGEITSISPSFASEEAPSLTVRGRDLMHKLAGKPVSQVYRNKSDSEIAREIGKRLGVKVTTGAAAAAEPKHEYLLQANEYDIGFLMHRAYEIGYDLFVEEGSGGSFSLYFGPSKGSRAAEVALSYGRTLTSFEPTLDATDQVEKATVRGWDWIDKKPITATATRSQVDVRGSALGRLDGAISKAYAKREIIIVDQPIQDAREAKVVALGAMAENVKQLVTAHGSSIGLPKLRAGGILTMSGLGSRFSGRYFVTGTRHSIGDGYVTEFDCRREDG